MRLLFLSLAVVLAASQRDTDTAFRIGREYIFQYETQVMSGIPQASKIYSGMKIKCNVRIQFVTDAKAVFKMEAVSIFKVNDLIEEGDPTSEQLPEDVFQQVVGKEAAVMIAELSKPVQFVYIRGHVREVKTDRSDPHWSVNIKRGIISLFQINLEERQSLSSVEQAILSNSFPGGQSDIYKVMEPSVAGECETIYSIKRQFINAGQPAMRVTKVRNYENCLNRPVVMSSIFNGVPCGECEAAKKKAVSSASQVRYSIMGTASQFIILSAIAESQHSVIPYSEIGGRMSSFVNQTLVLIQSDVIQEHIPVAGNLRTEKSGLEADYPELKNNRWNPHTLSPVTEEEIQERHESAFQREVVKQKIKKLLSVVGELTEEAVSGDVRYAVIDLLEVLRNASKPVIRQIWQELGAVSTQQQTLQKRIKKTLIDILPSVGTLPAVDVVIRAIIAQQIKPSEAATAMSVIAISAEPSIEIINRVMEVIQSNVIQDNVQLKRSAFLCLGALANKVSVRQEVMVKALRQKLALIKSLIQQESTGRIRDDMGAKRRLIEDKIDQITKLYDPIKRAIMKMVQAKLESQSMDDKILALKVVGNAGFSDALPDLRTFIDGKNQPAIVRSQAIYSLRHIAKKIPEQVRLILLPRFMDRSEPEVVRVAAYVVVTETQPSVPTLQLIAQSLWREPNRHVAAFVYEHLQQMSKNTHPCMLSLAKNATHALRFAKKVSPVLPFNYFQKTLSHMNSMQISGALDIGVVSSAKELVPRSAMSKINAYMYGTSMDLIEVGYNAEGLQTLISKLVGPKGVFVVGKSILDILKSRSPRSAESIQAAIEKIKQELKVTARTAGEPRGHMYVKLFGQELRYFQLDQATVQDLLTKGILNTDLTEAGLRSGKEIDIQKSVVFADARQIIPTEAGLPLKIKLHGASVMKLKGSVSISGEPALFASRRVGQVPVQIQAKLNIIPSAVVDIHGSMIVDATFIKSGVGAKSSIVAGSPIVMTLAADLQKKKIFSKIDVTRMKEVPVTFEVVPVTFVQKEPVAMEKWPAVPEVKEIAIANSGPVVKPVSFEYGTEELDINLAVQGVIASRNSLKTAPYCPMTGKSKINVVIKPKQNIQAVEFQAQLITSGAIEAEQQPQMRVVQDSPEESSSSWGLGCYIGLGGCSSESAEVQDKIPKIPEGPVPDGFIDLKTNDASVASIIQSMQPRAKILPSGDKLGMVARFGVIGAQRPKQVQLEALIQRSPSRAEQIVSIKMKRSPVYQSETQPWQMYVQAEATYPSYNIQPKQLLSPVYQKQINALIQQSVVKDGKLDFEVHLNETIPTVAVKQWERLTKISDAKATIDQIVNSIIESCPMQVAQQIKPLVQRQKEVVRKIKNLKRQALDPLNAFQIIRKLQFILQSAKEVKMGVDQSINGGGVNVQLKSALIKYIITKQEIMVRDLQLIAKVISRISPVDVTSMIREEDRWLKTTIIKSQQIRVSSAVGQAGSPVVEAVEQLIAIQSKIYSSLIRSDEEISYSSIPTAIDTSKIELLQAIESAKEMIDAALVQEVPTVSIVYKPKVLAMLLEACVQQQQIIEIIKRIVSPLKLQVDIRVQANHEQWWQLQELKEILKIKNQKLAKRVAVAVSYIYGKTSIVSILPPAQKTLFQKLQKIQMVQVIAADNLVKVPQSEVALSTDISPNKMSVKFAKSVSLFKQAQREIEEVVDNVIGSQAINAPVIVKAVKTLVVQVKLAEKIATNTNFIIIAKAAKREPKSQELAAIKSEVSLMVIKINSLRDRVIVSTHSKYPEEMSRWVTSESLVTERIPITLQKIIANQMQEEEALENLKLQPSINPSYIQQKLWQIMSEAENVQAELSTVKEVIVPLVRESPARPAHQAVAQQLLACIQRQKAVIRKAKEVIMAISISAVPKLPLIQKLEQLKQAIDPIAQQMQVLKQMILRSPAHDPTQAYLAQKQRIMQNVDAIVDAEIAQVPVVIPENYRCSVGIVFGSSVEKEIQIKITGKKSLQQLIWEAQQVSPIKRDELVKKFIQEKEAGSQFIGSASRALEEEINSLKHVHVVASYHKESIPKAVRKLVWQMQEALKARYSYQAILEMPSSSTPQNFIEFIMEIKNDNKQMDVEIRSPYEKNIIQGINIPKQCQAFVPFLQTMRSVRVQLQQSISSIQYSPIPEGPVCEVSGRRLITLDGEVHMLPDIQTCGAVLAMDCSSQSTFAVTAQPTSASSAKKIVKIIVEGQKVLIVPEQEQIKVIVNGQEVVAGEYEPLKIRSSISNAVVVKIIKLAGVVKVIAPRVGVDVIVANNGYVSVKVSPLHYSQLCGLCGNFDGIPSNDYESPNRGVLPVSAPFVASYLTSNAQCDASQIRALHKMSEFRIAPAECSVVRQTAVSPRMMSGVMRKCFSIDAVRQCPEWCRAASNSKQRQRLVSFHCPDAMDPVTQSLYAASSEMRPLQGMSMRPVLLEVLEPESCIPK